MRILELVWSLVYGVKQYQKISLDYRNRQKDIKLNRIRTTFNFLGNCWLVNFFYSISTFINKLELASTGKIEKPHKPHRHISVKIKKLKNVNKGFIYTSELTVAMEKK